MKIEIDTEDWDTGFPIIINKNLKSYIMDDSRCYELMEDVDIFFDDVKKNDENRLQAQKLCDLICDLFYVNWHCDSIESKRNFYDLVRKTLQEKLELIETATA